MSQPGEPVDRFYAFLRLLARFWIWFLFREVAVHDAGRVHGDGHDLGPDVPRKIRRAD